MKIVNPATEETIAEFHEDTRGYEEIQLTQNRMAGMVGGAG